VQVTIHLIVYLPYNDNGICCFPLYLIFSISGFSSCFGFFFFIFFLLSLLVVSFGQEQTRLQSLFFINRIGNIDLLFNVHVQVDGGLIIMIVC
jgi:hypothetical protein